MQKISEMSKKFNKIIDFIKVIIIYVLTFSMLSFAGIYINARQNSSKRDDIPTEKLMALEDIGYKSHLKTSNDFLIVPSEYVVTTGWQSKCCFGNSATIQKALAANSNVISSMFSDNSVFERQSDTEGNVLWNDAFESENFIYIKFCNEFLSQIIYAVFSKNGEISASVNESVATDSANNININANGNHDTIKVYELIIIPASTKNKSSEYYGISRDKSGNTVKIIPDKENFKIYDREDIIAYHNIEGMLSCEFLKNENYDEFNTKIKEKGIKIPEETVILTEENYSNVLYGTNFLDDIFAENKINTSVSYIKNLFNLFDFNIDKINNYFNFTNNADTYVELHGTLKFYKDGLIEFSSLSEEGVNIKKILGYSSENFSFKEKLTAASIVVNSLGEELKGISSLQLDAVTLKANNTITFEFSYYVDNIRIIHKNNSSKALFLTIKDNVISDMKFYSVLFQSKGKVKNIDHFLMLRHITNTVSNTVTDKNKENDNKTTIKGFEFSYNVDTTNEKKSMASWTALIS